MKFDGPIARNGDNFDRYLVRIEEIKHANRIGRQAIELIKPGQVIVDDWRISLPPKPEVYGTIEGVMAHFKLIMEGIQVPPGEIYDSTEAANGELGWYLVSDGSGRPYKVHVRAPGFAILSGISRMVEGGLLGDLIPPFDNIHMIVAEADPVARDAPKHISLVSPRPFSEPP